MAYKLLAIDMDGTFLNDERNMTQGNLAAVTGAVEAGLKVVICSGRMPSGLKVFLRHMPGNQPLITVNGSMVLDHNNEELLCEPIDRYTMERIICILRSDFEEVYYHFFDKNIACSERFEKTIMNYHNRNLNAPRDCRMELRIVPDSQRYIEDNNASVLKVEILEENQKLLGRVRKSLEMLQGVEVVSSGAEGLEVTKKGLNKGNSLEFLAQHYGYSLEECIAVGNDENDIEMIKKAGLGIAVSNAKPIVKSAANYITSRDNNNDAILEVFERFIKPVV